MFAMINSCAVNGLNGYRLTVEIDVGIGLSAFDIVGLPDASVRESRERVRAAIKNSGFEFPLRRITVNLAPADIRKEGPSLDLPIAIGILAATGQIADHSLLAESAFAGELSLEGAVRPISGALSIADHLALEPGIERLFLPADNAAEAGIARNLRVHAVASLRQAVDMLEGACGLPAVITDVAALFAREQSAASPDLADVRGQKAVKRALEIAAAGGHYLLMIGSPGSGKTMLARRLPTILPDLSLEESLEVTKIYSVCNMLPKDKPLITTRPFRAPHHGASSASIIGGGATPRPGEISLSCHGVLFLDEMPEFSRDVLEALRQPLEERVVTISRTKARADFPASFQLVGAMNPCPCGYYGDSLRQCTCTPLQRQRYFSRLSGPLLDRIDLHVSVPRVQYQEIAGQGREEESSAQVKQRVVAARQIQTARFTASATRTNAQMSRQELLRYCQMEDSAELLLRDAFRSLKMSGRAHDRILKVARTIADLDGSEKIGPAHLAEAIQYRNLDREEL